MADEGVTLTIKTGPGYEAAWIVSHGTDLEDAIARLNTPDHLDRVKEISRSFQGPPQAPVSTEQAVENVKAAMPGSEVIASNDQELTGSLASQPCKDCGKPAEFREGYSKKQGRHYAGYFCTADKNHKPTSFQWR